MAGADLEPKDAQVILDHQNSGQLAETLLAALADPHTWSEPVENGLSLLAWMLKAGCIEIRVALHRHRKTGVAIPYDSREDGYVHEKWAVFEDAQGNRLIAEGSLNESRTAPFVARLQDMADAEFRLTAHVAEVKADNERSGRAQAAVALGTAYGFITGRRKSGGGDDNFWKELDACRRLIAERTAQGGGLSVQRVPSIYDQVATAFVPFEVKRKISDDSFWVDTAPPPLLNAAFDAAARVAAGIKRKKADLTTEMALTRIVAEMKRVLS